MAGLVPAIHKFGLQPELIDVDPGASLRHLRVWITGTSPVMTI
jgi:hypothetical protein